MKKTSIRFGNSDAAMEYLAEETSVDNWLLAFAKTVGLVFGFAFAFSMPVVLIRQQEATATRNEWVRRDEETPEEEAERKAQARKDRAEYMKQYFKDHPIHNN